MSETNRAKEFQKGTAGVPGSAKQSATGLAEGSDIGFGMSRLGVQVTSLGPKREAKKDIGDKNPVFSRLPRPVDQ